MSMVVAHNLPAINANKNLYGSNRSLNKSLEKLSSGFRINTGMDGPADLVISEQLRSQANGIERAIRNTTESINVLSIAEGALNEMNSILKKMKALAVHSANNGVTSPEQIAADQAEMDSGIQTLERIASTTKYSDQFLLNGSKEITFSTNTNIKGTQNNRLINTGMSDFKQIFKRDGYAVSIGFNGAVGGNAVTGIGGETAMKRQASKAYLEVDAYNGSISQVDHNGKLTQGQSFILTGSMGSRQFRFSEGAHVSAIVSAIHNVSASTGVDASLTFNRNQQINVSDGATKATAVGVVENIANNTITAYDNYRTNAAGAKELIISEASIDSGDVIFGKNTDGNGNVYIKFIDNNGSYRVYKDSSLSEESLVGDGVAGASAGQRNHSGLAIAVEPATGGATGPQYGDVVRLSLGNIALNANSIRANGAGANVFASAGAAASMPNSTASGVQLGINTSTEGKLFFKTVYDTSGTAMIYAYKDALMQEKDMVAKTADAVTIADDSSIVLDSIWNDEHTANTGLGITLAVENAAAKGMNNTTETFEMEFTNLAMRIYSSGYGSNEFIKVQQFEGGLFVDYDDPANYDTARLIEAGTTFTKTGQDATITVNGQQMKTNGLDLNLATPDVMADITFNSGKTGSTTLAQVGYGEGTVFSKATSLTLSYGLTDAGGVLTDQGSNSANNAEFTALLNNACHSTDEKVSNFEGGMQLQLGEGAGDQERTVIGIKALSTATMGQIQVTKQFDPSKAVIETKTLSVQDIMGGQLADLSTDPATAMRIIEKAISDVSELRAQIGAVQSNMLQTNENNLRVSLENITKTESAIRDTDMASEMTEFTKNQILSNAGVSMLSQANQQAQSVMSLLQ